MKSMKKWLLLCHAALMLFIVSGCSAPQEDSVEDPLGAFNIDAVVPYETANPATAARLLSSHDTRQKA